MKEFLQRTLSGIIFVLSILLLLWADELSMFLFCLLLNVLALNEFYNLAYKIKLLPYKFPGILAGTAGIALAYLTASNLISAGLLTFSFIIVPLLTIPVMLYQPSIFFKSWGATLTGLLYISLPLALVPFLTFLEGEYHYEILLSIFILIWVFDSFAYIVGSLTGKTKIFPSLSPKKSWEGAAGGLLFTLGGAFFLSRLFGILSIVEWEILALLVVITATLGDFVESAIKRNANVKDSGKFLPGHGGFLDRFDSFLFSIPFVFVYLYILNH